MMQTFPNGQDNRIMTQAFPSGWDNRTINIRAEWDAQERDAEKHYTELETKWFLNLPFYELYS